MAGGFDGVAESRLNDTEKKKKKKRKADSERAKAVAATIKSSMKPKSY